MKKSTLITSFVIIIVLIAGFLILSRWITQTTGYSVLATEKEKILQCFKEKHVVYFYDSAYCPDCSMQENVFSAYINSINKIDCRNNPPECDGITQVPAWKIAGKTYYGAFGADELSKLANC